MQGISFCRNKVNEFYDIFQKIRGEYFGLVWTEASRVEGEEYEPSPKRHGDGKHCQKYQCI